jgi:hypothetical protein
MAAPPPFWEITVRYHFILIERGNGTGCRKIPSGIEQAAEKGLIHGEVHEGIPRRLKPALIFAELSARLKSCPFKESAVYGVFQQPVEPFSFLSNSRHG